MKSFRWPRALLPLIMLAASPLASPALSQGTPADYKRAATLLKRIENKTFRQGVSPHWLEGGQKFWYRVDTALGRFEFAIVDAVAGTRQAAFDHQKLALKLGRELKTAVDAGALPFNSIEPASNGAFVRFRVAEQVWQFDRDGALRKSDALLGEEKLTPLTRERASGSGGQPTVISFINRLKVPLSLFWIDNGGQAQSYGAIKANETVRRSTYSGHVWRLSDAQGRVVGIYRATDDEAQAIIEDIPAAETQKSKTESREAPPVKIENAAAPAFAAKAFVRGFNLWVRADDGTEKQLSTGGTADNFFRDDLRVSPDGRYVVASQVVPAQEHKVHLVESSPRDQVQPKLKTIDYLKPGDRVEQERVRLFDLQERREVPTSDALFSNQWSIENMGWNADGRAYRFLFNGRGHQHLRVLEMSLKGEVRAIVDENSPTFIDYSQKTYSHAVPGRAELIWASERNGWNHLYLYDTRTGQVKNQITQGSWVMRGVERVDDETRQIWFRAFGLVPGQDPYYAHLARINFDGSDLTILTAGDGNHAWKWSPDGRFLIDTFSRVDLAPTTTLREGATGRAICVLENADAKPLLETGWTLPERFEAPGRDGKTPIYGIIVRPSNFDSSKKYPVIESIYAGPQDFFVPKSFGTLARFHELAELGFIVVQIDGMGTNWRSRAFHDVTWKNLGDAGFPDRIAWLKAAQTARPWMDLSRVGIYGGSAGGQNALGALLFHGDFYKAAVADSGCHDNRMDKIWWNEAWMGWPVDKSYEDSSNVVHAKNLRGDLMLIYGELDTNVDPASTLQVVNELIKAGKDFDLLAIPGAGHGAGGSEYGRHRQNDFFVRHLLGVEPPARNAS